MTERLQDLSLSDTQQYKPTKKGIKFGLEEHAEFDETALVKQGHRKIPDLDNANELLSDEHSQFINHEREQSKGVGFNLKFHEDDPETSKQQINADHSIKCLNKSIGKKQCGKKTGEPNSTPTETKNKSTTEHSNSNLTPNQLQSKPVLSTSVQPKQHVILQRNLTPEQLLKLEKSDPDFIKLKSELINLLSVPENSTTTTRRSPKCDITCRNLHKMQYENLVEFFKDKNYEHISELTLSRNYLMSPLPSRLISAFPNVTRLFINENQLVEMPKEVLELKRLWYLDARSNKLQDLPDEMFTSSLCNSLIHLHLRSNRLAYLTPKIGCLKALTNLTLRGNRLKSLPDSIGTLSGLIQLDISYNKIDVLPDSLKLCKNLEMLLMEQNALHDLPEDLFKDMSKLMKIGMKHNNLKTLPMSLISTCIDVLNVESNRLTSIPNGILGKLRLISINLNRNCFKKVPLNDGPFQWPQLQNFSMDYNDLECIDLGTFSNAPHLHAVNIRNNQLNCLPMDFGTWNTVTELNLNSNKLRLLPDCLGKLRDLEFLNLSNNELKRLPKTIGDLANLKEFTLEENQLESLPMEIGKLKRLEKLNMSGNSLLTIPYTIHNLHELTFLSVADNNLQAIPKEIGGLTSLQELYLSHNRNLLSLPLDLAMCPNLSILALDKCPLTHFPQEYVMRGPAMVIQYMRMQIPPSKLTQQQSYN